MFRYLAIAWRDTDEIARASAHRHRLTMRTAAGWRSAFANSGLEVFVIGEKTGVNEVVLLSAEAGVVLGKLFRRHEVVDSAYSDRPMTERERHRIASSEGAALVDDFWGRYVAFLGSEERGWSVLRDPVGALPCFLLEHAGVQLVFSWLEDVLTLLPSVPPPPVDWDALSAFIVLAAIGGRRTTLQGVDRVLPGERVALTRPPGEGVLLWNAGLVAATPSDEKPEQAAEQLRTVVRASTRAWASCYPRLLLRLSGGLDSSIVLSCLTGDEPRSEVLCVNYHSPGSNSDERVFARTAANAAGARLLEHRRSSTYPLDRALEAARTPSPVIYLGRLDSTRNDAALARRLGIDVMWTGGGGDQLFFEWADWEPAADYRHVRGFDAGFPPAALDAARLSGLSIWRVMHNTWRRSRGRTPIGGGPAKHLTLAVREAMLDDAACVAFEHPALREPLPPGKRAHVEQLLFPVDYYDPYELDAAPEHVNPLLSQPAVELCLRTPTYTMIHGGHSRALTRRAFQHDLPESIVHRLSKGGLEDHLLAILQENISFARDLLLNGQLVSRGILDRSKLEVVLSNRPTTLSSHTTEIHIYIAIEAWLQRMNRP